MDVTPIPTTSIQNIRGAPSGLLNMIGFTMMLAKTLPSVIYV